MTKYNYHKKILLIFVLFYITTTSAQTLEPTDSTVSSDSLLSIKFEMQKSPTGALLRSAILPGWGQFYNESYWKVPIVWGVTGWFVYMWNDRNSLYKDYQNQYNISINETSEVGDNRLKKIRDFYRDDRDQFAFYIGLTYFLNLIDAYVDAHLFDFDISVNNFSHRPELRVRIKL